MPFLRLTLTPAPAADAAGRLADGLRSLMAGILRKQPELTAVLVEAAADGLWRVGTAAPARAAHLEATVTAGTNDAAEKAAFIEAAMALVRREHGPVPEATYVVVREIPAADWGYDGRTQASRRADAGPAG